MTEMVIPLSIRRRIEKVGLFEEVITETTNGEETGIAVANNLNFPTFWTFETTSVPIVKQHPPSKDESYENDNLKGLFEVRDIKRQEGRMSISLRFPQGDFLIRVPFTQ